MREILFRGRNRDGEWFEGSYHIQDGERLKDGTKKMEHRILGLRGECEYVDPTTVGQYTGLKDKNGKRIFEGDIVKFSRTNALGYQNSRVGTVYYYENAPLFYVLATTGDGWGWEEIYNIEVIGNIHDTPELLKED